MTNNPYKKQKALSSLRKRLITYCDEWKQKDVPILIAITDEVEEKAIMPYRVIVNMFVQKIKDIKHILEIIGVDVSFIKTDEDILLLAAGYDNTDQHMDAMPIAYLPIMKGKENLVQKERFWEARVKLQQWFETVCKEIDEIIKSVEPEEAKE